MTLRAFAVEIFAYSYTLVSGFFSGTRSRILSRTEIGHERRNSKSYSLKRNHTTVITVEPESTQISQPSCPWPLKHLENITIHKLISAQRCPPPIAIRVATQVADMRCSLHKHYLGLYALITKRFKSSLGLLPGHQLVSRSMDEECRCSEVTTLDLSARAAWNEFLGCGLLQVVPVSWRHARCGLFAWKTTDDDGKSLGFPVIVEHNAASGVGLNSGI
jgi:hypothetical protein